MVLSSDDPLAHRKPCTLCSAPRDVLIRCQIDDTGAWHLVCPGACWRSVSGGVEDGDAAHPHYRYGGAWKNRWADVTAKKPKKAKVRQRESRPPGKWSVQHQKYTFNDRVAFQDKVWLCRKSHRPRDGEEPPNAYHLWKEDDFSEQEVEKGDDGSEEAS